MNAVLWILGVTVALMVLGLAAEYGARWWIRLRCLYYTWPPGVRLHRYTDPVALPELERLARVEFNRDGERGDNVPVSARNYYRILVAGGSAAECPLLDQSTSWHGVLQHLLQAPENLRALGARNVHVGNIACSGFDSRAVALTFERVLPRYRHLDAIVIMVGASNVNRWLAIGAPSSSLPPPLPVSEVFSCHADGPFDWRFRQLALVEILKRAWWRWLRPVKVRKHSGRWIAGARIMYANAKEIRTHMPDPTLMLDHFEHELRSLLQNAKNHAGRVLVVQQPWFEKDYTPEELAHLWHGGLGDPSCENVTIFYSGDVVCRLMALMNARAASAASELNVEWLELMPILDPSLKTYYDFWHFTPDGATVVAAALASVLVRKTPAVTPALVQSSNDFAAG
jgi:hypothetical protein